MDRNIIEIDASGWRCVLDFYKAVLRQIGAPGWHGMSIDALIDSIVYGGINKLDPPYTLRFLNTGGLSNEIADELRNAKEAIDESRLHQRNNAGFDADVELEIA